MSNLRFPFPLAIPADEKLLLRTFESSDANKVFALIEESRDFLEQFNKVAQSIEEVDLMIHTENCRTNEGTALCLGIWYEDTYVGMIGTKPIRWKHGRVEIGYYIGKPFIRQGIAQKVLKVFINFLFNQLNMNRIEATTDTKNTASVRLLERLGFTREGTLRETYQLHGECVDEAIFSLLRKEQR